MSTVSYSVQLVLTPSLLRHAVTDDCAHGDEGEPLLAEQREPRLEGGNRLVVRVADGDRAAMLVRDLLDQCQLFGDRRGRLVIVEEHVSGGMRDPMGDREPDALTGWRGPRIEKRQLASA